MLLLMILESVEHFSILVLKHSSSSDLWI